MNERQSKVLEATGSPVSKAADRVGRAYDRFDLLRVRDEPFDEGDMQNVHEWMRAVTKWIEASS